MNLDTNYNDWLNRIVKNINEYYLDKDETRDIYEVIHEELDNALIYYSDQFRVMENTKNEDAVFEVVGKEALDDCESYQAIVGVCAYYALEADLNELIDYGRLENIKGYLNRREERSVSL